MCYLQETTHTDLLFSETFCEYPNSTHLRTNQSKLKYVILHILTLTKLCNGVDISLARHLNWPMKISMRNSAVGQSETLNFPRLVGQLPQDLHWCDIHHFSEECRWTRNYRQRDIICTDVACISEVPSSIFRVLWSLVISLFGDAWFN